MAAYLYFASIKYVQATQRLGLDVRHFAMAELCLDMFVKPLRTLASTLLPNSRNSTMSPRSSFGKRSSSPLYRTRPPIASAIRWSSSIRELGNNGNDNLFRYYPRISLACSGRRSHE